LAAPQEAGRILRRVRPSCRAARVGFFFFSSDRSEPVHVHVKRERKIAKFWLGPVRMAYNYGFSETELSRIAGIVGKHEAALSKAWHDYFKRRNGNGGSSERSRHSSRTRCRVARRPRGVGPSGVVSTAGGRLTTRATTVGIVGPRHWHSLAGSRRRHFDRRAVARPANRGKRCVT
jgi:hypothetical protein